MTNRLDEHRRLLLMLYRTGRISSDLLLEELDLLDGRVSPSAAAVSRESESSGSSTSRQGTARSPQFAASRGGSPWAQEPDEDRDNSGPGDWRGPPSGAAAEPGLGRAATADAHLNTIQGGEGSLSIAETIDILDAFHAVAHSGARTLRAWAEQTEDPHLAGGLRVAAGAEDVHACLLKERIDELGGAMRAQVPDWLEEFNRGLLDASRPDGERLTDLAEHFIDADAAMQGVREIAARLDRDPLSGALLIAIGKAGLLTRDWLSAELERFAKS